MCSLTRIKRIKYAQHYDVRIFIASSDPIVRQKIIDINERVQRKIVSVK